MLTAGALFKGMVRRFLPAPTNEGPEAEAYARMGRYNELSCLSMVRKSHPLTDEGTYFVTNNAQTGILEGLNTGFVITTPNMYVSNAADPSDPTAKSIYMDYIDLNVSVIGVTATAVNWKILAVYLSKGNNYSSGGTDLSGKIWALNPRIGANASIARCYFGGLTTTDLAVSKGTTRPIVGYRIYRMPVTATTVPEAVGDRLRLEFGGVESENSVQIGTTGALQANVMQTVMKLPPIVIPPGWSMGLYSWTQVSVGGGTYPTTATTWLPEAGWFER